MFAGCALAVPAVLAQPLSCALCPPCLEPPLKMLHPLVCLKPGFASVPPVLAGLETFPEMKASSFLSFEVWSRIEQRGKKNFSYGGWVFRKKNPTIESMAFVL